MAMPNFINNLLANVGAQTSTDGVQSRPPTSGERVRSNNPSTYTKPITPPVYQVSQLLGTAMPYVNLPTAYKPVVKKFTSTVVADVLAGQTPSLTSFVDIATPQFANKTLNEIAQGINTSVVSTASLFGIPTSKYGPIVNSIATSADLATKAAGILAKSKFGTSVLSNSQYTVYADVAKNKLTEVFNNPTVGLSGLLDTGIQGTTINNILSNGLANSLPISPGFMDVFKTDSLASVSAAAAELGNFGKASQAQSSGTSAIEEINKYKVYLVSALNAKDVFPFRVQPSISIQEDASYTTFSPMHAPGDVMSFKNSPSRTFSITEVKLISRTPHEAMENLEYLHMLRGWTKPYFGLSSTVEGVGDESRIFPNADVPGIPPLNIDMDFDTSYAPLSAAVQADFTEIVGRADAAKAQVEARRYAPHELNGVIEQLNRTRADSNAALDTIQSAIDGATTKQLQDAITKQRPASAIISPSATSSQIPPPGSTLSSFGSPPEVLYLYGYSESGSSPTGSTQNIRRIPVVISSISFTYPNTVDYIPTTQGVPFPVVMDISITLKETRSPYEMEHFSLNDFRQGKLIGW